MYYYVNTNKQPNGDNEVHVDGCSWLKLVAYPKYLGDFVDCRDAVNKAISLGYNANGCAYCANPCHTG